MIIMFLEKGQGTQNKWKDPEFQHKIGTYKSNQMDVLELKNCII